MLPSTIVAVDQRLNVLKRFTRIKPDDPFGSVDGPRRWERDYDRLFSKCIDVIEGLLRESGDIARDSRLKLLSEPGEQVARIDLLLAEVGPGEEFRRLVIVEDKLSTNRECRRDVLAQILEYAHRVQSSLTLDELPDAVTGWADDYREDIRRGMQSGNFLLIICGDCIDEGLASLVQSYVDQLGPSNLSDLVLIAMPIYSDGETHVLVPNVAGGTERATRDLTIRVEIQTPSGAPVDIGKIQIGETPSFGPHFAHTKNTNHRRLLMGNGLLRLGSKPRTLVNGSLIGLELGFKKHPSRRRTKQTSIVEEEAICARFRQFDKKTSRCFSG